MRATGFILTGLYFLGLVALGLLVIYFFSMIMFVFSDAGYVGSIAFTPKWIFLFSVFVLLGKTKAVREMINRLADRL